MELQKKDIRKLSLPELEEFFLEQGEKKFRAKQVYEWLWHKSLKNFDEMSNISLSTRELLKTSMTRLSNLYLSPPPNGLLPASLPKWDAVWIVIFALRLD